MNDTITHSSIDAGSDQDRQARVDLAAVYRLLASHGWGDVIFNHAAMRVPSNPRHFFIKRHESLYTEVTASNLKKPEMNPPSEVRQAIIYFVTEQVGLRREELPVMVSRVFGFKSTSPKVKELVEKTLASMHEAGDVVSRDDKLFLA